MHIADLAMGILGANGIVGGGIPIATGAALPVQACCKHGPGGGLLLRRRRHPTRARSTSALNLAAVWKLPVVFVCENNQYGMSTSRQADPRRVARPRRPRRGVRHPRRARRRQRRAGRVRGRVREARARAGPTARRSSRPRPTAYQGHFESDANKYRTKEEIAELADARPHRRRSGKLLSDGGAFSGRGARRHRGDRRGSRSRRRSSSPPPAPSRSPRTSSPTSTRPRGSHR